MTTLLLIHSILRWLIALVAVAIIVLFSLGWLKGLTFSRWDNRLTTIYSGLLDVQALLGLTYFLLDGMAGAGYPSYRLAHLGTMMIAALAGHLTSGWKARADRIRFRNDLLAVLASLLLIVLGVALLPGGWSR